MYENALLHAVKKKIKKKKELSIPLRGVSRYGNFKVFCVSP